MVNNKSEFKKGFTLHHSSSNRRGLIRGPFSKNTKNGEGFTLIELLVGMSMFTLIMGAIIGIFLSGIKLQRRYLASQDALNQLSFAIEYMSRTLRMAVREDGTYNCLLEGLNYSNPDGERSIQFVNHLQLDDCQKFYLDLNDNTLKYTKDVGSVNEETLPLTSGIVIEQLKFQLSGQSKYDSSQPRVTISLKLASPLKIELQTTISQRNLDVP